MLSTTPTAAIHEQKLLEATTSAELLDRIRRIRDEGLPGFVVRASGIVDIGADTHDKVAGAVANTLRQNPDLGWQPKGRTVRLTLGETNTGEGELHHDMHTGFDPEFRIQRTRHGSGKVTLANAGTLGSEVPTQLEDEADSLFHRGEVDPRLIHPEVHSAELSQGDMVVFPPEIPQSELHDKAGPVWHRFDTSSPSRQGEVLAVKLEK